MFPFVSQTPLHSVLQINAYKLNKSISIFHIFCFFFIILWDLVKHKAKLFTVHIAKPDLFNKPLRLL